MAIFGVVGVDNRTNNSNIYIGLVPAFQGSFFNKTMGSLPLQVYSWSIDSTKWNRFIPSSGLSTFLTEQKNIKRKQLISIFWLKKNQLHPSHPESSPPRSLQCWGFNSSPKAKILHRMAWQKNTKKKKQIEQFNWQLDASVDSSKFGQLFCRKKSPRKVRPGRFSGPGSGCFDVLVFFFGVCWFGLVGWLVGCFCYLQIANVFSLIGFVLGANFIKIHRAPWKINVEPKNGGLVQMMFLFNWGDFQVPC